MNTRIKHRLIAGFAFILLAIPASRGWAQDDGDEAETESVVQETTGEQQGESGENDALPDQEMLQDRERVRDQDRVRLHDGDEQENAQQEGQVREENQNQETHQQQHEAVFIDRDGDGLGDATENRFRWQYRNRYRYEEQSGEYAGEGEGQGPGEGYRNGMGGEDGGSQETGREYDQRGENGESSEREGVRWIEQIRERWMNSESVGNGEAAQQGRQ